ncbi:hypothetical protein GLE_0903 [Lysobacter enzymogenes]|uniref:Uncharacterized protein n=1 Tax=Lysobacter enzymogenes TaxID=69 RepID=A0A0S2DCK4_LYSEN|nr:hypothetical protein GLE_0903 [Lysobacter enzymogenes]
MHSVLTTGKYNHASPAPAQPGGAGAADRRQEATIGTNA